MLVSLRGFYRFYCIFIFNKRYIYGKEVCLKFYGILLVVIDCFYKGLCILKFV